MGKRGKIVEYLLEQAAVHPEPVPGQPIVEIADDRRVLIENHQGVAAYGKEMILVNVKFGSVRICGCELEILHMTKEQIVVFGRIHSIGLIRRK